MLDTHLQCASFDQNQGREATSLQCIIPYGWPLSPWPLWVSWCRNLFWPRWVGCGFSYRDRVWSTIYIYQYFNDKNTWFVGVAAASCPKSICPCRQSSLRLRRLLSHIFVGLHCSFNSHICERSFPRIACGHYRQRVHCLLAEPSSSTSQDEGAQMFAEVGLHCNSDAKMRGESSRKYSTSDKKKKGEEHLKS